MAIVKDPCLRRIHPQNTSERKFTSQQNPNPVHSSDITFIRRAFYLSAYVLPSSERSSRSNRIKRILIEYTVTFVLIAYVIGDLRNLLTKEIRYLPIGLTFSILLRNFFSVIIRIVVIMKRKDIFNALVHLQNAHAVVVKGTPQSKKLFLLMAFAANLILPAISFSNILLYQCSTGSEEFLKKSVQQYYFEWHSGNNITNCLLLTILEVIIGNQEFVLPGFTIVAFVYLFFLLRQLIKSFVITSRNDRDITSLHNSFVAYSQRVYRCVQLTEKAASLLLLILYCYLTCTIFNVTTFFVRSNLSKMKLIVFMPHFLLVLIILLTFYITGSKAIAVHDEALKIRMFVYKKISRLECSDNSHKLLMLIMVEDFASKVVVTGLGMFKFKKSFILQTASGILSYGALLSQMGKER